MLTDVGEEEVLSRSGLLRVTGRGEERMYYSVNGDGKHAEKTTYRPGHKSRKGKIGSVFGLARRREGVKRLWWSTDSVF